jgi:hypothetical protein
VKIEDLDNLSWLTEVARKAPVIVGFECNHECYERAMRHMDLVTTGKLPSSLGLDITLHMVPSRGYGYWPIYARQQNKH